MNKYTFTLLDKLSKTFDSEMDIKKSTKISELFSEDFDEFDWLFILVNLELIYGFEIPDQLAEETDLTLKEFGESLSRLVPIPTAIYPEFCELKVEMLNCMFKQVKIAKGIEEGTDEELKEISERLERITRRLQEITGFSMN